MRYPGGKNSAGVYQRIINLQPPHARYVEPFLGSGAIMARKLPAADNVGCDADGAALARARIDVVSAVAGDGVPGARFEFLCCDGISYLQNGRWGPETLIYCDPPYLLETRSFQRRLYRCELEREDHERLLAVLGGARARVQLSGYPSVLYRQALRGWTEVRYPTVVRSGAVREECLWMNYPAPVELHDYRYLGHDYRERERIRRKQRRWAARLAAMSVQERQALLSALSEVSARASRPFA